MQNKIIAVSLFRNKAPAGFVQSSKDANTSVEITAAANFIIGKLYRHGYVSVERTPFLADKLKCTNIDITDTRATFTYRLLTDPKPKSSGWLQAFTELVMGTTEDRMIQAGSDVADSLADELSLQFDTMGYHCSTLRTEADDFAPGYHVIIIAIPIPDGTKNYIYNRFETGPSAGITIDGLERHSIPK